MSWKKPAELGLRYLESRLCVGLAVLGTDGDGQDVSRETRPEWFRALETSTAMSWAGSPIGRPAHSEQENSRTKFGHMAAGGRADSKAGQGFVTPAVWGRSQSSCAELTLVQSIFVGSTGPDMWAMSHRQVAG